MSYISKETMEQQITEMWDAVNDIPASSPDRDHAINQAREIEAKGRETFRKQELIRIFAPELLKRLKSAIYLICNKQTNDNVFVQETMELIRELEK